MKIILIINLAKMQVMSFMKKGEQLTFEEGNQEYEQFFR